MLPRTLALIDDDAEYAPYLAQHLAQHGIQATVFADAEALLAQAPLDAFDFFLVDLSLPGMDGIDLIRRLRERSQAGVLVVSGRLASDVFEQVVRAGADMHLAKPVRFEQVVLAVEAVHRRSARPPGTHAAWVLDLASNELVAPDGARVALSEADLRLLQRFVHAQGEVVAREALLASLGRALPEGEGDTLNASIFRLRRRIERATPLAAPLQSKSRVGYQFRAPLVVA